MDSELLCRRNSSTRVGRTSILSPVQPHTIVLAMLQKNILLITKAAYIVRTRQDLALPYYLSLQRKSLFLVLAALKV